MDIKKRFFCLSLIIILTIIFPVLPYINNRGVAFDDNATKVSDFQEPKTSEATLIDKVYNFTTEQSWKLLEDIPFQAEYNYYIYFTIVTPHVCNITIIIIDPEGSVYDVYYRDEFSQEDGTLDFPFGAALTGSYDILFELGIEFNLNLYIKIEETIKCLHDIIPRQDIGKIKQYGVLKFEKSPPELRYLVLETDVVYDLYIARVTPLSMKIADVTMHYDYSLTDVDHNIIFKLNWQDTPLAPITEVTKYSIGTAHGGPYMTNLTVQYDNNPVNIAFAIVYDHKISGEIDGNETGSGGLEGSNLIFSIPVELATGSLIGIGAITLIALGVVVSKRRESNSP